MEPTIHNHFIDKLAFANSLVSGLALYPQVWTVLSSGLTEGVSLFTFALILLNSLVWLMYAIHRGLLSLGIASVLNTLASAILIVVVALS